MNTIYEIFNSRMRRIDEAVVDMNVLKSLVNNKEFSEMIFYVKYIFLFLENLRK